MADFRTVTASRSWQREDDMRVVLNERPTGQYTRRFFLGEGLDTGQIEAGYDHGVLTKHPGGRDRQAEEDHRRVGARGAHRLNHIGPPSPRPRSHRGLDASRVATVTADE